MSSLTQSPAWQALAAHAPSARGLSLRRLFAEDPDRAEHFSLALDDLLLDFSKHLITGETWRLLLDLARERDVEGWRERMFKGEKINVTEDRAVLHVALRNRAGTPILVDGQDVMPEVNGVLGRMRAFSEEIRSGRWRGHTGQPITTVVNIGIGGSDLGPEMVCVALEPYAEKGRRAFFVSNVDPADLALTLRQVDPERTLFVVASKTFTTQETMTNANSAREWLVKRMGGDETAVARHFVAVSTNAKAVAAFGIDTANMFGFWDWVGGRYSLWSAIGLPIALAPGFETFERLLEGAHAMDRHFRETPLERNLPVAMALLGVWYDDFLGAETLAILPYDQNLARFPAYFQQGDMESNGKSVDRDGRAGRLPDRADRLGRAGHQRPARLLPADPPGHEADPVRLPGGGPEPQPARRPPGQAARQLPGPDRGPDVRQDRRGGRGPSSRRRGMSGEALESLLPHKVFEGNQPSTSILYRELDPHRLGTLIALYEHKIFVQGVIWNINSFDQWGVELGKQLAGRSSRICKALARSARTTRRRTG